jgi:hypothetical protein
MPFPGKGSKKWVGHVKWLSLLFGYEIAFAPVARPCGLLDYIQMVTSEHVQGAVFC